MIKNYLLIALRNIRKHKFFAAVNIIGLSLSMSVCLVLILLIHDHFQYDKFHPNGDNVYRITTFTNGREGVFDEAYATSSLLFKEQLADNYSFIKQTTNLNSFFRGEIRSTHKILDFRGLYADNDFFQIFGFELIEGSSNPLSEPFNVVLTEELAKKLFPDQSAIGQTIDFEDHGNYKVTAIVKTPPGKTHMVFEALASINTLPLLVEKKIYSANYSAWESVWFNYNYLALNSPAAKEEAERVINDIAEANFKLKEDHPGYVFRLQALNEIVPGRIMSNEIGFALPWFVLAFFALLGIIVLVTATINYTNLSIAKSLSRAKEIGIRKVNGADRKQIILQFLVESVLMSVLSLAVAFIMYRLLITSFNEIWIFSQVGITLEDSGNTYIYFILFALVLGILTGIGPSLFLSKMDTVKSLKGSMRGLNQKKRSLISYLTGKRTLLSIQFSLSMIMLITILVLKSQADFLVNSNYGFDDSQVFFVEMQGHSPELIKEEFGALSGVEKVSFTSHHPAVGRSHGDGAHWKERQENITLYHFSVDENYIDVMSLELIAGSNFPKVISSKNEKFVILNERAVEVYGFDSPTHAIGEVLTMDSLQLTISGVVKDYHWEPLMKSILPLGLRIMPDSYEYAYFKLLNSTNTSAKKSFEDKWISFDATREYAGGFLNEQLDEFYQFFYDFGVILGYIALLAISITSLGFLGMVSFEMKTKVKEIGIRKVLGASFRELTFTLSKGFLIMITLTSIFAIPFAVWANGLWVNNMAFHAPIDSRIILPAIGIIALICLATILSQVWINANKNPSETLRTD